MVERIVVGQLGANAYLFSSWRKECIIIDAGGDAEKIIAQMTVKNLKPRGIVFTHGHLDHISAGGEIVRHFKAQGTDVKLAIHSEDAHYLGEDARDSHMKSLASIGVRDSSYLDGLFVPVPEPDVILSEGDEVFGSDLKVIHTPGHTRGSICLYSLSQGLLFTGDTLFFEGIGRTDMVDGDGKAILESIKNKLFTLPRETRIFPGHGPFSTIEREIPNNPFSGG